MPALAVIWPIISAFLKANWKWIAIGALIVGVAIYIAILRHQLHNRNAQVAELSAQVQQFDAAMTAMRQSYAANISALTVELAQSHERAALATARKDALAHANPADDKPAVILDDLLDRLQPPTGAAH